MFRSTSNRVAGIGLAIGLGFIMSVTMPSPAEAAHFVTANCMLVGTDRCTYTENVNIGRRGKTSTIRGTCFDFASKDSVIPHSMEVSELDRHTTRTVQTRDNSNGWIGQNFTAWSWRHRDTVKVTLDCRR